MIITIPSQGLGTITDGPGMDFPWARFRAEVSQTRWDYLGRIVTCFLNFVGLLAYGKYIITPRDVVQNDGR
jgi:hypothetical protein